MLVRTYVFANLQLDSFCTVHTRIPNYIHSPIFLIELYKKHLCTYVFLKKEQTTKINIRDTIDNEGLSRKNKSMTDNVALVAIIVIVTIIAIIAIIAIITIITTVMIGPISIVFIIIVMIVIACMIPS